MPRKSGRMVANKKGKPEKKEQTSLASLPNILTRQTRNSKRKADQEHEEMEREMQVDKRRKQFQSENDWMPIEDQSSASGSALEPETMPFNLTPIDMNNSFRPKTHFAAPVPLRNVPLPPINWADPRSMWENMLRKEILYTRNVNMLDSHSQLQPRMRAILLDWIIEVCEVYRLHRESFYLCIDFLDRYLSLQRDIKKEQLQLIGISALFIAAKLEEIYPPKLSEFSYVTDGACTENEILQMELIVLKVLKWDLSPLTPNGWLNCYLQLANLANMTNSASNFVLPNYSVHSFTQIIRVLDLCILDIQSISFNYSVLATSALYHMSSEHIALSVSGYRWSDIAACVHWMAPFAAVIHENGSVQLKFFQNIPHDEAHSIQTHVVDLQLLERVQQKQENINLTRSSPDFFQMPENTGILTPPQSDKKPETMTNSTDTVIESFV